MAVVGLTKTLSIEGNKRNILVNCIAPLAASRMTATVFPPDLLNSLKPEYVVPLVLYLTHDSNTSETGSIFEIGGGYITKLRWEASKGVQFDLDKPFTLETVASKMDEICTFDDQTSYHPNSANDSFAKIMSNLDNNNNNENNSAANHPVNVKVALAHKFKATTASWNMI